MEALHAWAVRPAPAPAGPAVHEIATRDAAAATQDARPPHEVVLVVVSVPGGKTTLTRLSRPAAEAAVHAEDPAILGSVTTPEGRTIYVRDAVREALDGRAPEAPVAVHSLRARGDAVLDDVA